MALTFFVEAVFADTVAEGALDLIFSASETEFEMAFLAGVQMEGRDMDSRNVTFGALAETGLHDSEMFEADLFEADLAGEGSGFFGDVVVFEDGLSLALGAVDSV